MEKFKYFGCDGISTKKGYDALRKLWDEGKLDFKGGDECEREDLKIGFKEDHENTTESSNPETNPDNSGSNSRIPRVRFCSASLFVLIITTLIFL